MLNKIKLVALMAVATAVCNVSVANLIDNGGFETGTYSEWSTWDRSWVREAVPGLAGTDSAADLQQANATSLGQDFIASGPGLLEYQVDFVASLNAMDGTQRFRFRGGSNEEIITLKMDSSGLHKFAGASWFNAVAGTYVTGTEYHIRINVGNFDADAAPEYTLGVSTDGVNYNTSIAMGSFHGSGTTEFEKVRFESIAGTTTGMIIDEVSVIPEPATLGLVAVFGAGVLFVRRRLAM